MNDEARRTIAALDLAPLPREGGWFRQTHCDGRGSAILFLLAPGDFSALHRMAQDELWHFHTGDPVEHVVLAAGRADVVRLGPAPLAGDRPQRFVPRGCWQGARLAPGGSRGFALVGCTVTPPWDDRGFELGDRAALAAEFPAALAWIEALVR